MIRTALAVTVVAAALALVPMAMSVGTKTPMLTGTVGPGFTITLKKAGVKVRTFEKARGGKFERAITSVGFTGTKTIRVKLTKGKWEYYCAPHEDDMHGDFTVK